MMWQAAIVLLFCQLLHVQAATCTYPCGTPTDCTKSSDFFITSSCLAEQATKATCYCGAAFTCRTNTDAQLSYGGTCAMKDGVIATTVIVTLLICASPFICCFMGCTFCANCCCYRPPTVVNTPAPAPAPAPVVMVQQPQPQTAAYNQPQPQMQAQTAAPQFQQQPQAPAPSPAPQFYSQPAAALPQWMYLDQNNQPQGPIDQSVLAGWLKAGQVPSSMQVCQVGGQQYAQAATFPALVPAPAGVQPVNQSQVQVQLPQGSAEYHGMPAPAQPLPTNST
jgi:hypothetical protein